MINWSVTPAIAEITATTWEEDLLGYATERVQELQGVRLVGTAREKASILSFVVDGVHPHDVGAVLDDAGAFGLGDGSLTALQSRMVFDTGANAGSPWRWHRGSPSPGSASDCRSSR